MKHIRLVDYLEEAPEPEPSDLARDLAVIPEWKLRGEHVIAIDCPDCGRSVAFSGACRKCAGKSWLPAGHVDRFALRRMRKLIGGGDAA